MADLRDIRGSQSGRNWTDKPANEPKLYPTEYEYTPGFGLQDLGQAAYEPTADVTPVVGDVRAAQRGGEYANQAYEAAKQGNYLDALQYGLGATGEYATTVPGVGETMGLAKVAGKGLVDLGVLAAKGALGGLGGVGGMAGIITSRSGTTYNKTAKQAVERGLPANQSEEWAKMLIDEGVPMRQVARETGYYKDRFGNWKTQIDDTHTGPTTAVGPIFKNWKPSQKLNEGGQWPKRQLEKVFYHPKLFKEYPWMKGDNVKVEFSTRTKFASAEIHIDPNTGRATGGTIYLNPQGVQDWKNKFGLPTMNEAYRSMMLHEMQHIVQGIDNLPSGSSADWWKGVRTKTPALRKELNALESAIRQLPDKAPVKQQKIDQANAIRSHLAFIDRNADLHADRLYITTQGEMDAMWTQANRDIEDVRFRLPIQEDRGATYADEGTRQVKFNEHEVALTSPKTGLTGTRMDSRPASMVTDAEKAAGSKDPNLDYLFESQDLSALGQQEARYGMKQKSLANLYHGTGSGSAYKDILESGFRRGRSAELGLAGTSVSRDPLVSHKLFAYDTPENVLKVDYTGKLEDVRNLSPSEYYAGVTAKPGEAYGKPQTAYHEAEVFGVRGHKTKFWDDKKLEEQANRLSNEKAKMNRMFNKHYQMKEMRDKLYRDRVVMGTEVREMRDNIINSGGAPEDIPEFRELMQRFLKVRTDFTKTEAAFLEFDKLYEEQSANFRALKKGVERGGDVETIDAPFKPRKMTKAEQAELEYANVIEKETRASINQFQGMVKNFRLVGSDSLTPAQRYAGKKSLQAMVGNLNTMKAFPGFYERALSRRDWFDPFSFQIKGFEEESSMYDIFSHNDMRDFIIQSGYKPAQASKIQMAAQDASHYHGEFLSSRDTFYEKATRYIKDPQYMRLVMEDGSLTGDMMKDSFSAWKSKKGINPNNIEDGTVERFARYWAKNSIYAKEVDGDYRLYKKARNKFMDVATKEIGTHN